LPPWCPIIFHISPMAPQLMGASVLIGLGQSDFCRAVLERAARTVRYLNNSGWEERKGFGDLRITLALVSKMARSRRRACAGRSMADGGPAANYGRWDSIARRTHGRHWGSRRAAVRICRCPHEREGVGGSGQGQPRLTRLAHVGVCQVFPPRCVSRACRWSPGIPRRLSLPTSGPCRYMCWV